MSVPCLLTSGISFPVAAVRKVNATDGNADDDANDAWDNPDPDLIATEVEATCKVTCCAAEPHDLIAAVVAISSGPRCSKADAGSS